MWFYLSHTIPYVTLVRYVCSQYYASLIENVSFQEDQENVQILPAGEGQQANQKRITTSYMTKYERARVLGTRALQIA